MLVLKTNKIDEILQIDKSCFKKNYYTYQQYYDMSKNCDFYIIYEQYDIVGFIILLHSGEEELELIKIGILEKYRRKSFGYKSINFLINNLNFKKLFLEVSSLNDGAINLYKKIGFKEISRRKSYYKDNSDAIIYLYEK